MSDVLDASAVLALLRGEPGADIVEAALPRAVISAVNLAEVCSVLTAAGLAVDAVQAVISGVGVRCVPTDEAQAFDIGALRPLTRGLGLSIGDRACIALGRALHSRVLTADRAWTQIDFGVPVVVIR
jgi:PIN domain nuclease of toxin-antitoxin system